MARIRVIPPRSASGELASAYLDVRGYMPKVGRLVQICSLWPEWVRLTGANMLATLEAGSLPRRQKELLAVATSRAGGCGY
jgi:hypothetical protein